MLRRYPLIVHTSLPGKGFGYQPLCGDFADASALNWARNQVLRWHNCAEVPAKGQVTAYQAKFGQYRLAAVLSGGRKDELDRSFAEIRAVLYDADVDRTELNLDAQLLAIVLPYANLTLADLTIALPVRAEGKMPRAISIGRSSKRTILIILLLLSAFVAWQWWYWSAYSGAVITVQWDNSMAIRAIKWQDKYLSEASWQRALQTGKWEWQCLAPGKYFLTVFKAEDYGWKILGRKARDPRWTKLEADGNKLEQQLELSADAHYNISIAFHRKRYVVTIHQHPPYAGKVDLNPASDGYITGTEVEGRIHAYNGDCWRFSRLEIDDNRTISRPTFVLPITGPHKVDVFFECHPDYQKRLAAIQDWYDQRQTLRGLRQGLAVFYAKTGSQIAGDPRQPSAVPDLSAIASDSRQAISQPISGYYLLDQPPDRQFLLLPIALGWSIYRRHDFLWEDLRRAGIVRDNWDRLVRKFCQINQLDNCLAVSYKLTPDRFATVRNKWRWLINQYPQLRRASYQLYYHCSLILDATSLPSQLAQLRIREFQPQQKLPLPKSHQPWLSGQKARIDYDNNLLRIDGLKLSFSALTGKAILEGSWQGELYFRSGTKEQFDLRLIIDFTRQENHLKIGTRISLTLALQQIELQCAVDFDRWQKQAIKEW